MATWYWNPAGTAVTKAWDEVVVTGNWTVNGQVTYPAVAPKFPGDTGWNAGDSIVIQGSVVPSNDAPSLTCGNYTSAGVAPYDATLNKTNNITVTGLLTLAADGFCGSYSNATCSSSSQLAGQAQGGTQNLYASTFTGTSTGINTINFRNGSTCDTDNSAANVGNFYDNSGCSLGLFSTLNLYGAAVSVESATATNCNCYNLNYTSLSGTFPTLNLYHSIVDFSTSASPPQYVNLMTTDSVFVDTTNSIAYGAPVTLPAANQVKAGTVFDYDEVGTASASAMGPWPITSLSLGPYPITPNSVGPYPIK